MIQAENTQLFANGQTNLKGKVSITKGGNRLHTDTLTLLRDPSTNEIISGKTSGNILFEQPHARIFATQATFTNQTNIMQLLNTQYRFYNQHARGQANKIIIKNNQYAILNQVNYTTCAPNDSFWLLSAKKLILDKKKRSLPATTCNIFPKFLLNRLHLTKSY